MKKIALIFVTSFLIFSCKEKVDNVVKPTSDELSTIKQMDNASVKLFKKEVSISDPSKKNSLKILVASKSDEALNAYLANVDISLSISKEKKRTKSDLNIANYSQNNQEKAPVNLEDNENVVYLENLSKSMESDISSYSITVTPKPNAKNAKVAAFTYITRFESALFDDWMEIHQNPLPQYVTHSIINIDMEYRLCGVCNWKDHWAGDLNPPSDWHGCNVDARRLGAWVKSDANSYFNVSYGNY